MSELGDILALAHGARERLTTLRATVWHWGHARRGERAWKRFEDQRGGAGVRFTLGDGPPPETSEHVALVWVDGQTRSRLERRMTIADREELALTVIDGDRSWTLIPGHGALEGASGSEHGGFEYAWMLDPLPVLASLDFRLVGRDRVDGRAAVVLRGPERQPSRFFQRGLAPGADDHDVAVDAELGIVLRMTARIDGEPFGITELRDVAVGIDLPPATFVFDPPPGQRIIRVPPPGPSVSTRSWFTVEEVASVAPFPILAPRAVHADRGRATLVGGDWPTPTPNVAYLFYDLPPALDLVERAVADAEPAEGWEPVEAGGLTAMVRRRRARHPAGRHEVRIVRDGTEVRLNSDLELERLLEIAASLERVRPAEQP